VEKVNPDLVARDEKRQIYTVRYAKEGEELTVVSMRNAIFMGLKPTKIILDRDVQIHKLTDQDGIWMTSLPQELEQVDQQSEIKSIGPSASITALRPWHGRASWVPIHALKRAQMRGVARVV